MLLLPCGAVDGAVESLQQHLTRVLGVRPVVLRDAETRRAWSKPIKALASPLWLWVQAAGRQAVARKRDLSKRH